MNEENWGNNSKGIPGVTLVGVTYSFVTNTILSQNSWGHFINLISVIFHSAFNCHCMIVHCFQDSNRRNSKGGGRRVTKKGSSDGRGKKFKTPESEVKHRRKVKRDQKRRDNRRLKEFIFNLIYSYNFKFVV